MPNSVHTNHKSKLKYRCSDCNRWVVARSLKFLRRKRVCVDPVDCIASKYEPKNDHDRVGAC